MKGKHIQVDADSKLLTEIRRKVNQEVIPNLKLFRAMLFLKLTFYGGLSSVLYYIMYLPISQYQFILTNVFLGLTLLLFAFNFAHDFSHNTIFTNKKWNNLGFIAIYTLVGAHAEAWRERHVNSHHFAPNVKEYDTDLQITHLIRVSPDMPYNWYHRFQFIYAPFAYSTYSLYWILIKDFKLVYERIVAGSINAGYIFSFMSQKIFYFLYLLISPLLFSHQPWEIVMIGFVMMHLVQSIFLLFTFFMTHHVLETTYPETDKDGVIQTSWLMNQVRSSNDMHPFSQLANYFLGGFNNHIAHHLFPHIHHFYYPKLNVVLYQVLREHQVIPNQTTYMGGAISHLRLLKKLSRKADPKEV